MNEEEKKNEEWKGLGEEPKEEKPKMQQVERPNLDDSKDSKLSGVKKLNESSNKDETLVWKESEAAKSDAHKSKSGEGHSDKPRSFLDVEEERKSK